MIQYRIQQRSFTSNIIERSFDVKTWVPYIAPLCKKVEGDTICENFLHKSLKIRRALEPFYKAGFTNTANKLYNILMSNI